MKRTRLRRLTTLKRYVAIRKMSPKRKRDSVRYGFLRLRFLLTHPVCQVGRCKKESVDVHHIHGRIGSRYLDTTTWLAVCRWHHDQIHKHPASSRAKGLLA